jgi:hypothetical protein
LLTKSLEVRGIEVFSCSLYGILRDDFEEVDFFILFLKQSCVIFFLQDDLPTVSSGSCCLLVVGFILIKSWRTAIEGPEPLRRGRGSPYLA